jgi:hypothetical protein
MSKPQIANADPDVKVPAAILAAAARADAIHAATYNTVVEPAADPAVVPAAADPATVPAAAAPAVTTEVTDPAPVVPVAPPNFEHMYNSMKGRHSTLERQLTALTSRLTETQSLLSTMQAAPAAVSPDLDPKSFLTKEQRAEYGEEFVDVVQRAARELLAPQLSALRQTVDGLDKRTKATDASTLAANRTAMYSELNRVIPDWKVINNDQNFINWLALPDTYSNAIRHDLLSAAYEGCDAPRVLAFFNGFLAEEAATTPRPLAPALTPPVVPAALKVPLEQFAAPGRAKTTAALDGGAPVEKPTFTRAQITAFYAESNSGGFRGREAEKARIEAAIFDAQRDGRIR